MHKMVVRNISNPFANESPNYQDLRETISFLERLAISVAENSVRTLQSNNVFVNGPNLVVDEFADSNGTNNTVNLTETNAVYNSGTDTYEITTGGEMPFVIIEATSISAAADFAINNCVIIQVATGKWQLSCTQGTLEVQRAQIYKTLFYGTDGSNPRASATYITGITAIKTNVSRDIGKQAHLAIASTNNRTINTNAYTGTFVNTTTNNSCSTWSYVSHTELNGSGNTNFEIPSGTIVNTTGVPSSTTIVVDETGTDLTADEKNNPATCQLEIYFNNLGSGTADSGIARSIILCVGDITWGTVGNITASNIDFLSDNSIPVFTEATEDITVQVVCDTGTTTLDGNEKGFAISVPDSTFPAGTSITVTVSDGTNSLSDATINTISKGAVVGNPWTLSSGTLKLTFTLATTDTSATPTLLNYGVSILR